jgi:hypothetical protein
MTKDPSTETWRTIMDNRIEHAAPHRYTHPATDAGDVPAGTKFEHPFIIDRQFVSHRDDDDDVVNHPPHYTAHPSGVECIQITEHMGFCLGNAVKYIWRADLKADAIQDLEKAAWYIDREIERRERE